MGSGEFRLGSWREGQVWRPRGRESYWGPGGEGEDGAAGEGIKLRRRGVRLGFRRVRVRLGPWRRGQA